MHTCYFYDGPDLKLFSLVGLDRRSFVCCLVHRRSTDDLLLLQISSGVVWQSSDLQLSRNKLFRRCFFVELNGDIYVYARRIGQSDNRGRRVQKRPFLCTFSHYTEVDMVMGEAKRLKNTPHAVDRDYPSEISAARKLLWPEVKRQRSQASSSDNIQLKYPAKMVKNGQIVQDAFPYWDTLVKASVCGDFRYITQDELLLPTTSVPGVPGVPSMPTNSNVLVTPSCCCCCR